MLPDLWCYAYTAYVLKCALLMAQNCGFIVLVLGTYHWHKGLVQLCYGPRINSSSIFFVCFLSIWIALSFRIPDGIIKVPLTFL